MRFLRWIPVVILGLLFSVNFVDAEQIRLADGRFLQGDVVEVKDDGFVFKLTESGGQVFLRWNQVDEGLKKRLTNQQDPDEGLNLEVTVPGARLELIDGTVYEGDITRVANGYRVKNADIPNGKVISDVDVIEDGFVTDIMIDAAVMMTEQEVLKLAETDREPLETARQYYELARIADRLALYQEAKDYVTLSLASGPDSKLQARLTEYDTQLDELIRQAAVLELLVEARKQAKKKVFQGALNILDEAKNTYKPTGPVLAKVDDTYSELDLQFTKFVIDEWYKQMKPAARDYLRDKENKDVSVTEALNWARRQMDIAIQQRIMTIVGGTDPNDIKARFGQRFDLQNAKLLKLSMKKAGFGEDGFYQIVGGHLPIAGKKPQGDPNANPTPNPRGNGRRGPGSGSDGDGIDDPEDGYRFQEKKEGPGIPLPEGISPDDIKDILKRALGEDKEEGETNSKPKVGKQDISHLKVPDSVPSLTEWWDKAGTTTKNKWLVAVYVKFSGTMTVYEYDDWDIKFK
jgi:tetratricopeptide (TPR) repeat protein